MPDNLSETILLLDDDAELLDGFRRRIGTRHHLCTFTEPAKALEAVRRRGPFPVIVSDMRMPQMDGLTFLRQVRRLFPETVCIILTGAAEQGPAVQAVNDGYIFRFLKKPCSQGDLLGSIEAAIREYRCRCNRNGFQYRLCRATEGATTIEVEAGTLAVSGYTGIDFMNHPQRWDQMVLPQDRSSVEAFYAGAWSGKPVVPIEYRIRRKDGQVIWVRNTLLNQQGGDQVSVLRLDGQLQDITEQKVVEERLAQAHRRYEKMVANVPGLVFQCKMLSNGDFTFTFVSHSSLRLLGVTAEQIYADSDVFFQAFTADDRSRFFSKLAASAERLSPLLWQGCHEVGTTGRWFQGTAQPERVADGSVLWDGLLMDITEQKESERQAEFLARFPEENPNPVLCINPEGRIIYANDASGPLLSRWDRDCGQILPQDMYEQVLQTNQSGAPLTCEQRCGDHYYAMVFAPVHRTGNVNLYARDITTIKTAERELRNTNQILIDHDRLKSKFVSTVTHELRTPLCIFRNILSNTLAGVHGSISKGLKDNLTMAQEEVERLSRIISDFLDISRIEAGSLKLDLRCCSLNALITETCRSLKLLAAAKKIKIRTSLPPTTCQARIDRDRIAQVLINLIGNAIKFIPLRGHIHVSLQQDSENFKICVQDDGPGMAREEMEHIFDRFVQTKILKGPGQHGTGLGLAISQELVRMHGGDINVQSDPGKGCTFWFTLPGNPNITPSAPACIADAQG